MDARDGKLNQHTYVADCRARNKVEWCISGRDPFVVLIRNNFYFASFIKSQKTKLEAITKQRELEIF